jgi:hypothetical protein
VVNTYLKKNIKGVVLGLSILFSFGIFFTHVVYAQDVYIPGDSIVIGEFIYNDDYTPTTDNCTVSVYSPAGTVLVNEVTMSADATGWHHYSYTTPGTEGKYPTFITCGTSIGGDLLKLDKSFILKAPVVTDASIAASVWSEPSRSLTSFGTLVADISADVWSSPARSLTTYGTLVSDIWANSTRTLTAGSTLTASDVWTYGTRNLTDGTLTSGSLATVANLSGLATAANVTSATAPLATSAVLALVKTKTDTIDWTDITTVKNNVATLITEVGTGNISGIKTKTDTIAWSDVTGLVTTGGLIKAKTDTVAWADVTGIKTKTDTIDWTNVTGIKTKTDTILWSDIAAVATSAQLTAATAPLATSAGLTSATGTITSAIGALNNISAADVWSSPARSLTTYGTLVSDIWANSTRTLTAGSTLTASDVWTYGTRNLTDGTLTSGSLATVANLSGLATAANVTSATAPLATSAVLALVKTKTDTIDWTDITTVKNNVATLITEVGTGNISGIKTKTDTIAWSDVTGLVTTGGLIKAKTDTVAWADVTGIKTKTDTIDWTNVTGIKTKTDTILWSDIAAVATSAQLTAATAPLATSAGLTSATGTLSGLIANIPSAVWAFTTRTLTSSGTLATDVWNAATRTLTSLTLSSQSPWSVSTSDFGTITAGSNYLANVTTVYNGTLTDALSVPTVTIYDPSRNVIVNNVAMTRIATGTYSYAYATPSNAPAGTWESVFSANVETGKTLPGNDYWTVVTTPAQVIINSVSDTTTPQVAANITITNEGLSGNEYQYEWCVVSSADNTCGGGDDVFHAVAAKYINPGEDFNTTLTADVASAGAYYFKVIVYFGTDSSGASRSFTATTISGGGGGGGGGGGTTTTVPPSGVCTKRADFNCDKKVNSIDFSILLYYWKATPPFKNQYVDINKDTKVDSVDFSILLYEWDK